MDNEMESGITGMLPVLFVAGVAYGGIRDADPKQLQRMSNGSLLVFSALLHPGRASLSARNSFRVYPLYIYIYIHTPYSNVVASILFSIIPNITPI